MGVDFYYTGICVFRRNAGNPDALCDRDLVTLPAILNRCHQVGGVPKGFRQIPAESFIENKNNILRRQLCLT